MMAAMRHLVLLTYALRSVRDEEGQWTMPSKDYAATRYSGLAGITAQNASSLHPVWTFSTACSAATRANHW